MTTNCSTKTPAGSCQWDTFLGCTGTTPLPITDDATLQQFVASAGGSSSGSNYSLCYGVAVLKARRFIYYKTTPGDCGSTATDIGTQTVAELAAAGGLRGGAAVDPEPISKSILTGLSAILGGFGAAHAAAVANEETTLCRFSVTFNQYAQQIEEAVTQGAINAVQAGQIMASVAQQTDPMLASVAKTSGDFAAVFRIVLRAYAAFAQQIVYPYLAQQGAAAVTQVQSAGAPGTSGQSGYIPPPAPSTPVLDPGQTSGNVPPAFVTSGLPAAVPGLSYYGRQSDGGVFRLQNGQLYWGDTWQQICENLFGPSCNTDANGNILGCGPCGGGTWTKYVTWVNELPAEYPVIVEVGGTPISAQQVAAQAASSGASGPAFFSSVSGSPLVFGAIILAAILLFSGGRKEAT